MHEKAIVVDTHNDVLPGVILHGMSIETDLTGKTHSDLARSRKGEVGVQVFSMEIVTDPKGLGKAVRHHKLAAMMGVGGGNAAFYRILTTGAKMKKPAAS